MSITVIALLCSMAFPASALTADELLDSYYYTTTLGGNVTNRGTSFSLSNKPHGLNYVYNFKDYRSDGKTILVQQFDVSNSGGLASNIGAFRPTSFTSVDILGNTITHNSLLNQSGAVSSYDDSNGRFSVMWEQLGENTETYNSFRMTMVFEHGYNFHDYMNFALLLNWYAPVQTVVVYTSDPVIVSVSEQATMTDIKAAIDQASKDVQASIDRNFEELESVIKGDPIDETPNDDLKDGFDDYQSREDEILDNVFNGSIVDPDSGEEIKIDMKGNIFDQIKSFFGESYQSFLGVVGYGTQIFRFVLQFFINGFGILLIFPLTLGLIGAILGRS